jgi:hypothetical protein
MAEAIEPERGGDVRAVEWGGGELVACLGGEADPIDVPVAERRRELQAEPHDEPGEEGMVVGDVIELPELEWIDGYHMRASPLLRDRFHGKETEEEEKKRCR